MSPLVVLSSFLHTRLGIQPFYPCEIILSHIPVPARGKDKKQTATRKLHADHTLIPDVIVMLK